MGDSEWRHDPPRQTPLKWVSGLFYACAGFCIYIVLSEESAWYIQGLASMGLTVMCAVKDAALVRG